jgi:CRP-like cAMP-binding protein
MKLKKAHCNLTSCAMCRSCRPEWLPAIDAHRVMHQYAKGELLFKEGDTVKGMFFIYEGVVKVHKKWDADKELILRFAKDGAIAGHRGLGADTIYPVSATALSATTVCFVELDFFMATLKVNIDYLFDLMLFFAAELKDSEKRMRNLAHMSAKGRITDALLRLHDKFGLDEQGFINLSVSRQDIASYTGTTYETLFRMMNELVEEGLINTDGKKIRLLRPDKLAAYGKMD